MYDDATATTCRHEWTAGIMVVHDEDVATIAQERRAKGLRPPQCEKCDKYYDPEVDYDPYA